MEKSVQQPIKIIDFSQEDEANISQMEIGEGVCLGICVEWFEKILNNQKGDGYPSQKEIEKGYQLLPGNDLLFNGKELHAHFDKKYTQGTQVEKCLEYLKNNRFKFKKSLSIIPKDENSSDAYLINNSETISEKVFKSKPMWFLLLIRCTNPKIIGHALALFKHNKSDIVDFLDPNEGVTRVFSKEQLHEVIEEQTKYYQDEVWKTGVLFELLAFYGK